MKLILKVIFSNLLALFVKAQEQPNIIFLLADDQNISSVGCYGNNEVTTPNIDKLGEKGVIFKKHYNTTAICMASRASILTGMYEYKTGTNFTHGKMKAGTWEQSYPVLLRNEGYLTAFAGKFGFIVEDKGLCAEDFDMWGGGPGQTNYETKKNKSMSNYAEDFPHSTLSYGAFGQDVIKEAVRQKKPFNLSISFKAPHRPVKPDPKFNHIYADRTFTKPANFGREAGAHMPEQSKSGRQYARFYDWDYAENYDAVMREYYQLVYAIDVAVGMIVDELEKQGIADNTVIIFTSDNGYICGAHGYASKVLPMEESSRAPLIILDPRIKNNEKFKSSSILTGNIDLAPTILELAGLPTPKNMDGVSLVNSLEEEVEVHNQLAFMNTWGALPTQSLTCLTKDNKYTYWWYGDEDMEPTEELYDLANDPLEMKNLASEEEAKVVLNEMRRKYDVELNKWKKESVDYNNYRQYGTLFDRSIPWQSKNQLEKE